MAKRFCMTERPSGKSAPEHRVGAEGAQTLAWTMRNCLLMRTQLQEMSGGVSHSGRADHCLPADDASFQGTDFQENRDLTKRKQEAKSEGSSKPQGQMMNHSQTIC